MTTNHHITLSIASLDCVDCARTLEAGVAKLDGVLAVKLNFAAASLDVDYDAERTKPAGIVARVRDLGYDVVPGEELTFDLDGLDCADCAAKLQQAVASLPGVLETEVAFATAQMRVRAVSGNSLEAAIVRRAGELGYAARLHTTATQTTARAEQGWRGYLYEKRRNVLTSMSVLALAAAYLMRALNAPTPPVITAYALAILSGGYYIVRSGWAALRTTRSLDMNALMSIAAIGAIAIGEWDEGATAMVLFAVGNALEARTMDRARQAIRKLIEISPKEATRIHDGYADRVPVEQLRVGDLIEVKPGEKLPMDGSVEQGRSDVNQAPITGEATPVDVQPGSAVFAGSINGYGALLVRVTKLARDNTLSRIVKMVQEAQSRRAPAQRFVDTFAKYYTPTVMALAGAIALLPPLLWALPFYPWLYRALVLLVIACPCALVISTPVAIVSAISNAARRGILIKGGAHLEAIGRVQVMAFDKTGTLTTGRAAVTNVEVLNHARDASFRPENLLALAASIESHSQHPVARAIWEEANRRGLALPPSSDYVELTGQGAQALVNGHTYYVGKHGLFCEHVPHEEDICQRVAEVEGEGKTAVLVSDKHDVLGLIAVADQMRHSSAEVVQRLCNLGIAEIVLLSGDNERTANAIGAQAGIRTVQAGLLPQDKVQAIERLLAQSGTVAMVGDGVNDAPALARATVGIAMGAAGSDAALETADIVLMSDDLHRVPYVIRLGRRTLRNIQQNIALSLLIKGIFLVLAAAGLATLWMAVFADMGTSLIVTFNGMRLLRET
ncbi:MAG: cadmium-translocating P-type ATPase [Chloroflexi bacterium]|nr:cadmium-translocating P-type ATPase [Chloroflexota bacterium]